MAGGRQRSQSDVVRASLSPGAVDSGQSGEGARDFASPRRALTSLDPAQPRNSANLRRRSTHRTASLAPRQTTVASRAGGFTLAGPDDSVQLRTAHEAFVHPGYAELNPSYEQPNNARPVWSLAKPLPRVVRPGMVPTKQEILDSRVRPELPAEQSQRLGLDVDPNDLEAGKIKKSKNPAKIAAQVQDARIQREKNFLNALQDGSLTRTRTRQSRFSSQLSRRGRTNTWTPGLDLPGWEAEDNEGDEHPAPDEHVPPRPGADDGKHPAHLPPLQEQPEPDSSEGKGDDADSATTVGLDDLEFGEDLQPLLDAHIEEEVHNNHTAWSVVRTHYRESLAELLAVMVQLTIGFSSDLSATASKPAYQTTTDWAWGLATMVAIYVSGGISGAHLNPTITTMLWFFRGFPKRKMPHYFAAQFLGAFLAALIAYGVYYPTIQEYLKTNTASGIIDSFVTSQRYDYVKPVNAFFNEFLGTGCLVVAVLALGDDQNAPPGAGMNAFVIGLVIVVLGMAFGYQTGAALNPSRDFGPRLALLVLGYGSELFTNPFWFYGPWAGTLCGAFTGAVFYDSFIFTGGESPINYPWSRTKRAFIKSRGKWARRLRLKPKRDDHDEKMQR